MTTMITLSTVQTTDREDRCSLHPNLNPYDQKDTHHILKGDCMVCRGIYYGVKFVPFYDGEFSASQKSRDEARMVIGPMSLMQFGHVRHKLQWHFHFFRGKHWCTDAKTRTIYLNERLPHLIYSEFQKEWGCNVYFRTWTEPKVTSDTEMTISIGNEKIPLTVTAGMTSSEVLYILEKVVSNIQELPKENVAMTEVPI